MTDYQPLDIALHLDSEATIAEYLAACLEDDDPAVFVAGLAHVARARGMTDVAAASGLGRQNLYKALSPGAHPRHDTIQRVVGALGLRLTVVPREPAETDEPLSDTAPIRSV